MHIHSTDVCVCGNTLKDCCDAEVDKIRITYKICRCSEVGPYGRSGGRQPVNVSSTKRGNVRVTWNDIENNMIAEQKYSNQIRAKRHSDRQKALGGRVFYE